MRRISKGTTTTIESVAGSRRRRNSFEDPVLSRSSADDIRRGPDLDAQEILLSPSGTLVTGRSFTSGEIDKQRQLLVVAIRQRIESRLGGRIRELAIRVVNDRVVLQGRCATYYTKQLAQHAALGILDDEQLENDIVVSVPS